MLTGLSSDSIEKCVLSLLKKKPTYLKALDLNLDLFQFTENKELAKLIVSYVKKYQIPPSADTLSKYATEDYLKKKEDLQKNLHLIDVFGGLPDVDPESAPFYFSKAEDMLCGRDIYSLGEFIQERLGDKTVDSFSSILRDVTTKVVTMAASDVSIKRGFLNAKESVLRRKNKYKEAAAGTIEGIVPYGIKALDDTFGGMKKSFLTLIYSKTGGGKTRTMMNIAYASAKRGTKVLYFTLEMDFDLVGSCFDSRSALLDSHDIIFGRLKDDAAKKYNDLLRDLYTKSAQNDIWLVDIPDGATTITIRKEIELYKTIHGCYPDLVIIDYAHLVEPHKKYGAGDRSMRFDCLFEEFHKMARTYNVAIITAVQESREKSKSEAKKKKGADDQETEEGTHNIGASNYIAPHCETVIRLKQTWEDQLRNKLIAYSDKNRTGKTGRVELVCVWNLTYVGDRCPEISGHVAGESVLNVL